MSKENIYSKKVDLFQGYLRFHRNISIKFLHKKWRKRRILQQLTKTILFCSNNCKITHDFLSSINSEILRVIVADKEL